jgi:ankyrin repeat protein
MKRDQSFLISLLLSCTFVVACSQQKSNLEDTAVPALISAAESGDTQHIADLLKSHEPVDIRDSCHWTPLMKASLYGHEIATNQLISAGANLDLTDKGGYSALMLAASNNHAAVVQRLLEQGANPNMQESTKGWTALIWAAKRGHKASVLALLQGGAATEIRDFEGQTARSWAIANQHTEIAELLKNRYKEA